MRTRNPITWPKRWEKLVKRLAVLVALHHFVFTPAAALATPTEPSLSSGDLPLVEPPPSPFSSWPRASQGVETLHGNSDASGWLDGLTMPDFPARLDHRVLSYLESFRTETRARNTLRAWIEAEQRYGPWLRRLLREEGVPEDLVAVAMVESGFDPLARSRAGAVGIWQFVEDTGTEYGLTVDRWVDQRRDPERSTRAAATYFRHLHDQFGSWELAFAAYNMGSSALHRSIQRANTNDYWSLANTESGLPFETTYYVSKIIACSLVLRNPDTFDLETRNVEPIAFAELTVPGGTNLGRVARTIGVSADALRSLNPSLRRNRLPPGPRHRVRVPPGRAATAPTRWNPTGTSTPQAHRVRFGDTLTQIAWYYQTTESELRELNEITRSERVRPGDTLLVPPSSSDAQGARPPRQPTLAPVTPVANPPEGLAQRFFVTTGSESARDIADHFSVAMSDLHSWNQLDVASTLPAGMVIQLYLTPGRQSHSAVLLTPAEVIAVPANSDEFYDLREAAAGRVRMRYLVQAGDTLSQLAERFGLSVGSICRINEINERAGLRRGQSLLLYLERDKAPASERESFDARVAELKRRYTTGPQP